MSQKKDAEKPKIIIEKPHCPECDIPLRFERTEDAPQKSRISYQKNSSSDPKDGELINKMILYQYVSAKRKGYYTQDLGHFEIRCPECNQVWYGYYSKDREEE